MFSNPFSNGFETLAPLESSILENYVGDSFPRIHKKGVVIILDPPASKAAGRRRDDDSGVAPKSPQPFCHSNDLHQTDAVDFFMSSLA